ncbi:MAG: DUF2484 family protein [Oceanicola sp.]|jgi:hypothetical protein|nr:DUF2484 family protein [Oceanicola sp.]
MVFVCLWVICAAALSAFPSKKQHWPLAYGLIAVGIPILIYVWLSEGTMAAVFALCVGALVLRWPVIYLWRWTKRQVQGE